MSELNLKNIVEAALHAAHRPLSVDNIVNLFAESERPERSVIREAIAELQEEYGERGVELVEVASGWRVQVRSGLGEWISRLWQDRPPRYSRALLETLSIVAYRQPVTRGEIEEIRGVSVSSTIVRTLLDRGWLRVVGHRDVPGKPALFATTREFLDYFGLKKLEDLPPLADLKDLDSLNVELELGFEESGIRSADIVEPIEADADGIEANQVEVDQVEVDQVEADQVEADQVEADRVEADRVEADRVEADRVEADRVEADRVEADRVEADQVEADRVEADQVEADQVEADQVEADQVEADQVEADHLFTGGRDDGDEAVAAAMDESPASASEPMAGAQPSLRADVAETGSAAASVSSRGDMDGQPHESAYDTAAPTDQLSQGTRQTDADSGLTTDTVDHAESADDAVGRLANKSADD